MTLKNKYIRISLFILLGILLMGIGILIEKELNISKFVGPSQVISPFISKEDKAIALPLLQYSIPNLLERDFQASIIQIEDIISQTDDFTSYVFSYTTTNKKMTGQINIPKSETTQQSYPVIVMLRGWAPLESYYSGMGTKNAAAVLAKNGYITVAPDFFGYGESDPEPEDSWETRFIKPVNVIELIKTIKENPKVSIDISSENNEDKTQTSSEVIRLNPKKIGIWAHSNGGQIALATLEVISQTDIIEQNIPTTLWAPVTAPFPYSVLFFSDELEDEGKASRAWIAIFEKNYNVFDFTITKHLDKLAGPIQLHHGTTDDAAIIAWSDEFVEKIEKENKRRKTLKKEEKDPSEETILELLDSIDITYHRYPGANHNLQPNWDTVVQRDLKFFEESL